MSYLDARGTEEILDTETIEAIDAYLDWHPSYLGFHFLGGDQIEARYVDGPNS